VGDSQRMSNVYELVNVSKSYANHIVLKDLNITIFEGEMVAIIGKSGSGKTTILNMMGMLEVPDKGTIQLFDDPIPRIHSRKANQMLRTKISYLFQNYALIDNATVEENLDVPLVYSNKTKKEKRKVKIEVLEKVGLNISLKRKIHELSGGEQQRIAIARIMLKSCELILADEPTGSLDTYNRDEIIKLLKELNATGKTIIIVTHDSYVAQECSRVIDLN
jgi:putative ABC transport system ATP-binding protein